MSDPSRISIDFYLQEVLFHYNLLSIIVFIYWGVKYNSYNTITRDVIKYTHSRESYVYFSHIPRKRVITIKYTPDTVVLQVCYPGPH